jgi:hypothetical protein
LEPSATKRLQAGRFARPTVHRDDRRADTSSLVPLSGAEDELLAQGPGVLLAVVNAKFDTGIPPARQDEVTLVTV